MKLGITLPTFTNDPSVALRAAATADAVGLDGVFAFDHLWPMGSPGRPALWSFGVLAAVAVRTERVHVGTLVARVGLLPDEDLLAAFAALEDVSGGGRVIAGVGTGDHLSAPENRAYGVAYPHAAARLAGVEQVAAALVCAGVPTWVGGRSAATRDVAARAGAGRNLWGAGPDEVAAAQQDGAALPVTWGGQVLVGRDVGARDALLSRYGRRPGLVAGTVQEVAAHLAVLRAAGAAWCVCAPLDYIAAPDEAVETVGLVREAIT
ncbi:MAG TPA: LLM class flavin-dependent oxidoreductase [Acidimicrobiales bacterium]|nr:LLM class flavin-dependent oxidoreductase [Acidimicrobiales bacterium]